MNRKEMKEEIEGQSKAGPWTNKIEWHFRFHAEEKTQIVPFSFAIQTDFSVIVSIEKVFEEKNQDYLRFLFDNIFYLFCCLMPEFYFRTHFACH